MIKLHRIDATNRALYADALDQHHVLRKAIYMDERRWSALRAIDGREVDQFDGETTVYLLAIDDATGRVSGGTRLLPSTGPTLLSEVFPGLAAERGFRRGPEIWEWTRFFVAREARGDGRLSPVAGIVAAGMVEHCLEAGIPRMNVVAETFWIPKVAQLGWRPQPLGLPLEHEGMTICAFTIDMTEAALAATRAVYGVTGSCLAAPAEGRSPVQHPVRRAGGLA